MACAKAANKYSARGKGLDLLPSKQQRTYPFFDKRAYQREGK